VNGRVVRELGTRADPARDVVALDGERIRPPEATATLALHKPRGVVSTLADPEGRPTVRDLLPPDAARVYPVGRLDVNTTGLLLLTNDGALANALLHPRHGVPRVYQAKVRGTPDAAALARLRRGVRLDDGKTAPARVRILETLPTKSWLEVTVHEGRQHLVRRMCDTVGHPVEKLARVRFGPVALGTLPAGAWRPLGPRELAALRRVAGLRAAGGGGAGAGGAPRARGTRATARRARPGSPPPRGARGRTSAAPSAPPRRSGPPPRRSRP
jgi:23S rRNA pseudouridine2605 synthase